jgi:hypothetical protein
MRLYYFDIEEDGVWTADEQGSEWPSLAEADAEAVRTLTEMARESFPGRYGQLAIIIRDRDGPLLRVKLEVASEDLRPPIQTNGSLNRRP